MQCVERLAEPAGAAVAIIVVDVLSSATQRAVA
jgi:hypothetical protein